MTTLLLRLAGPLQSWGDSSRFARRDTKRYPTKSGVLGLLAAADGRRRTDPIEDLAALRFGVRADQPGSILSDYQTARPQGADNSLLSTRYYLSDAAFLAGVEGDRSLLEGLSEALDHPKFPLFLGRRSCPASGRINLGLTDESLESALRGFEWLASPWYRKRMSQEFHLDIVIDAAPEQDNPTDSLRDVPVSFSSEHRRYGWREVAFLRVTIDNGDGRSPLDRSQSESPDWLAALEGM